jgi:hypothetical protein
MSAKISVGSIVIRVDDLQRQTAFWTAALDYVPRDELSDDFRLLKPRNGIGPNISLDQVRSTLQIPPRIHLDLYADDQAAEVERLIGLGATRVGDHPEYGVNWTVLNDIEGNEFCVAAQEAPSDGS